MSLNPELLFVPYVEQQEWLSVRHIDDSKKATAICSQAKISEAEALIHWELWALAENIE